VVTHQLLCCAHLRELAEAVLRMMMLDFVQHGISSRELQWWMQSACWFPHLRHDSRVLALRDALPEALRTGTPCEPQLLWSLPEEYDGELRPHVDEPPPWANGRRYLRIVGVALTSWRRENGSPHLFLPDGRRVVPALEVGDVLVMKPDLPHTRGINRSAGIRAGVYFRFLEEERATTA
jgi:hypothetical protein